jgi:hypothetical protein
MRNFKKLKSLSDYLILDVPIHGMGAFNSSKIPREQQILRMLVKTKYSDEFKIPDELKYLESEILRLWELDKELTGIRNSWCYITVRSGVAEGNSDEFHFDGGSMRVDLIPERNYVWVNKFGIEYKLGSVKYPDDFDPMKHNMFTFAEESVTDRRVWESATNQWILLTPFCLHRRNPESNGHERTFIRVSFVDIEVRDVRCTQNSLLPTEAYGRDPVKTFRDKLTNYRRTDA